MASDTTTPVALLGCDREVLRLVRALGRQTRLKVVAGYCVGRYEAALRALVPGITLHAHWEPLLAGTGADVTLVAHDQQEPWRADALRGLTRAGRLLWLVHPACAYLLAIELDVLGQSHGGKLVPYCPALAAPALRRFKDLIAGWCASDDRPSGVELELTTPVFAHNTRASTVLRARDVSLLQCVVGPLTRVAAAEHGVDRDGSAWSVTFDTELGMRVRWSAANAQQRPYTELRARCDQRSARLLVALDAQWWSLITSLARDQSNGAIAEPFHLGAADSALGAHFVRPQPPDERADSALGAHFVRPQPPDERADSELGAHFVRPQPPDERSDSALGAHFVCPQPPDNASHRAVPLAERVPDAVPWDGPAHRIADLCAILDRSPVDGDEPVPWSQMCDDLEVLDAVERSKRDGRAVVLRERSRRPERAFQQRMALGGCLLLLVCLAILVGGTVREVFMRPNGHVTAARSGPEHDPVAAPARNRPEDTVRPLWLRLWPAYPLIAYLLYQLGRGWPHRGTETQRNRQRSSVTSAQH